VRLRLVIILLLLVLVPLGVVAALGVKVASDQGKLARHQFENLLHGRLGDVKNGVGKSLAEIERHLLDDLAASNPGADELRAAVRSEPFVRQFFVVDGDGRLSFPPRDTTTSVAEGEFLERTTPIWERRAVLYNPPGGELNQMVLGAEGEGDSILTLAARHDNGWIAWYWEEGLHLLFWRRKDGGGVVGAEIERIALLSRIVGRMPTTELDDGRIVMVDSKGDVVYQWGPYERGDDDVAVTDVGLAYPLDAWRLEFYASPTQQGTLYGGTVRLNLILGLIAVAIALLAMAIYFYREYSQKMRDAAQRVNFVTQVSHELKTPLANIRLYAELMEGDVDEDDEPTTHRLGVIVAESQRLTRLINNILAFSKHTRDKLEVRTSRIQIDEVIEATVSQFRPALAARGIDCEVELSAPAPVLADGDSVGQIIANLVSNVEKYAAAGGKLEISSLQADGRTSVTVADLGPGIPGSHRDKIFAPFYRVSDKLTDGVTGTGIGLTISRELARRNGGELELVSAEKGTRFRLVLAHSEGGDDESPRS
jgi:signal transduction histidine kinase